MATEANVLSVEGYTLDYVTRAGPIRALDSVDLRIARGEVVGLVGESGSGKTSLAWAIMRALASNAVEMAGSLKLSGQDLRQLGPGAVRAIRGRRIGMIFQDPSASLNPTMTLGAQITEALVAHMGLRTKAAREAGKQLLAKVGLSDPAAIMRRYPHEASGGEKQRVVIATAFACRPELILFDEPTTALDVITARQILDLLRDLQAETAVASLYISHDLAVVSRIAQRVAVIHRGRIVDEGSVPNVFTAPSDSYTRALLDAVPKPERRLVSSTVTTSEKRLVEVRGLTVRYGRPQFFGKSLGTAGARDVSFDLAPGEILGIVGESGSGKSTLARALTGLAPFTGTLLVGGREIASIADMDSAYRRTVQIVFQHPDASLNPRQRIGDILARPFALYGRAGTQPIRSAVRDMLEAVQLPSDYVDRFPHQLSGGEKQRVAIARAFAAGPALVICDEVTSSLDVSVQAAVIDLLVELRRETGTAYLFISHDINLVRQIAHRIIVMHRGELVEAISADDLAARGPSHPYTARLIAAVPTLLAA
jgi:peptide/nickel transport system ATP-binding protein